ncbi:MAG: T9SS type A sorting domain-containing protein [Bacteroidota bacterium]
MKRIILLVIFTAQFLNALAQNWLPTGNGTNNGFNGGVNLQTYNGKLIAGGAFSQAGTAAAHGVAMWYGTDWSIVDSSMNNFFAVRPLIIFQGQLYGFVSPINNTPGYIIRLDSSFKWHIVPNSNFAYQTHTGYINSACVYNNELYIGGYFDTIGNIYANHVAKWDGAAWTQVGTGINNEYVNGMIVYNNELYIGGAFTEAGGITVNDLTKWNGSVFSDVGGGLTGASYWAFRAFEIYNNELYIGGDLDFAGGVPMAHITRWNGSSFDSVCGGFGSAGSPEAMKVFGNKLYLGGYFSSGVFHNQACTWDGVNFDSLGIGLNAGPTGFEIYNCQLYAGGRFNGTGLPNGVAVLDTLNCSTGVNEIHKLDYSISIAPNPFTSQTTLRFGEEQTNTTVVLTNLLGQEIKTIPLVHTQQLIIDKGEMKPGVYFVQTIDDAKRICNKKMVVE